MENQPRDGERFVRIKEVMARTGVRSSFIYAKMKEGKFPRPIALSRRTVVWPASTIDAWIAEQMAKASRPEELGA